VVADRLQLHCQPRGLVGKQTQRAAPDLVAGVGGQAQEGLRGGEEVGDTRLIDILRQERGMPSTEGGGGHGGN
jgi:hypothetical protein